jgi:hypothetical protein
MTIAIAKWIGTLAPTIVFGVYEDSAFILALGALCSVVDLACIALLAQGRHVSVPACRGSSSTPAGRSRTGRA